MDLIHVRAQIKQALENPTISEPEIVVWDYIRKRFDLLDWEHPDVVEASLLLIKGCAGLQEVLTGVHLSKAGQFTNLSQTLSDITPGDIMLKIGDVLLGLSVYVKNYNLTLTDVMLAYTSEMERNHAIPNLESETD